MCSGHRQTLLATPLVPPRWVNSTTCTAQKSERTPATRWSTRTQWARGVLSRRAVALRSGPGQAPRHSHTLPHCPLPQLPQEGSLPASAFARALCLVLWGTHPRSTTFMYVTDGLRLAWSL